MKRIHKHLVVAALVASPVMALAEKPEWAGQGKPSTEQTEAHKHKMKAEQKESVGKAKVLSEKAGHHHEEMKMKAEVHQHKMKNKAGAMKTDATEGLSVNPDQLDDAKGAMKKAEKEKHAEAMARQAGKKADKMEELVESDKQQPAQSKKWWKFWQ